MREDEGEEEKDFFLCFLDGDSEIMCIFAQTLILTPYSLNMRIRLNIRHLAIGGVKLSPLHLAIIAR